MLEKSQTRDMGVDIISLPEIKFLSSVQKLRKSKYQSFLVCLI